DSLFEARSPDDSNATSICCIKPSWVDVKGFINSSSQLRKMGLVRWVKILTIKCPEDWNRAKHYSKW
ncbi:hypothetical protein FRC07_013449, partial [Ceratobasidium sp. 392]